jgi:hypothetical protein
MKFGIFGDSFASGLHEGQDYNELTWATQLARMLGATELDYHAYGGSPFYYSYNKILELGSQYDRIIVAVTEPRRYTKKISNDPQDGFITNMNCLDSLSPTVRRHMVGWFLSQDYSFMFTAQQLMIDHLVSLFPNIILIPSFKDSLSPQRNQPLWTNFALEDISHYSAKQCGQSEGYREIIGPMATLCHIPVDWHQDIAHMLYNSLVHGKPALLPNLLHKYPKSHYYQP